MVNSFHIGQSLCAVNLHKHSLTSVDVGKYRQFHVWWTIVPVSCFLTGRLQRLHLAVNVLRKASVVVWGALFWPWYQSGRSSAALYHLSLQCEQTVSRLLVGNKDTGNKRSLIEAFARWKWTSYVKSTLLSSVLDCRRWRTVRPDSVQTSSGWTNNNNHDHMKQCSIKLLVSQLESHVPSQLMYSTAPGSKCSG